ncbi:MAG TPA: protein-methionine-sulfoxide reductase heme-binding subunit MsrQ [Rhizobiaceae bacterium]|nr:protein-methionine-sulfoxide reductase heme-binding subunit MsrQ [Rhizobiaceae bacterium]
MAAATGWIDSANQALKRVPVVPLYFIALIPAVAMFWAALSGTGGADPVRALETGLGSWALKFMLASLAVTPLRERVGLNMLRFRRMIGLTAFFYAVLHFSVWIVFDRQLQWAQIAVDLTKRPWIIAGMTALVLLLVLAVTSNDRMVARLGAARWRMLHRLAYLAAAAIILHYLWLVKSWTAEPLAYAAITVLLLGYRLLPKQRPARARTERATGRPAA